MVQVAIPLPKKSASSVHIGQAIILVSVFVPEANVPFSGHRVLAVCALLLGLAAWWSSVPGYLAIPRFTAYLTRFQIKPEEDALLGKFGSEFGVYMSQVRRWV